MVKNFLPTVHPLAGLRKVKVQAISLEARVSLADTVILPREEKKKKKHEELDGRRQQNPVEARVSAQWAAGLQGRRVSNKS